MASELQPIERGRDTALRIIEELPFIVGEKAITESKKHMALAFGAGSPQLFECSEQSVGYAIALSAMSGLYPGGPRPDVWLIPRKNDGVLEVNWQISSRGYHRLARLADYEGRPFVVHDHDEFDYDPSESRLFHRPSFDKEGTWKTIRLAYLRLVSPDGTTDYWILRKDQIKKRRDCAQTDKVWTKWPEEQTLKTVWSYAGAREAWPTDEQSRFAMATSDQMESGDLVTLHESDGRPLLAADIAAESPSEEPALVTPEQGDKIVKSCKDRKVRLKSVFEMQEWDVPNRVGEILSSEFDNVMEAIVEAGISIGGCKGCGKPSEENVCSPECGARAAEREGTD